MASNVLPVLCASTWVPAVQGCVQSLVFKLCKHISHSPLNALETSGEGASVSAE